MSAYPNAAWPPAGLAFDAIAELYDDMFTRSLIGRAQRNVVWEKLRRVFRKGDRILELNCGTGEDAIFLAGLDTSVVACDASERMIAVAARRIDEQGYENRVQVRVLPTERIGELREPELFDGVLSDFSGLNCVADMEAVARQLAMLVKRRGTLVLCLSTRVCLWETLWFLAHGEPKRACRRWTGQNTARLGNIPVAVHYPTLKEVQRLFAPCFALRSCKGVGVAVPPSYVEHLAQRYPRILVKLQTLDAVIAAWPLVRQIGDHVLLELERTGA